MIFFYLKKLGKEIMASNSSNFKMLSLLSIYRKREHDKYCENVCPYIKYPFYTSELR